MYSSPYRLFQYGKFKLHSGDESDWKINCDALWPIDWDALARITVKLLPPFGKALGVPTGGLMFAKALNKYRTKLNQQLIIVDDVLTTGLSMEEVRLDKDYFGNAIGVVVFARGECPDWIIPLFQFYQGKNK